LLGELDFEGCQRRLAPLLGSWSDVVVPQAVEPHRDTTYTPEYAWMHTYERQLRKRIEGALGRPLMPGERKLFGADGAFSEALSNAFLHGHGRNPALPIRVSCAVGKAGLGFVIGDQGPGFDVTSVAAKVQRGGAYFRVAGNGLRALAGEGVTASYSDGGRTVTLLVELVAS
jgi:Histidine kinase-like ATPase domain